MLVGRLGMVGQVAAQLADIDEHRAVLGDHVVPEGAGRELLAQHHRPAVQQGRADGAQAASGVIERQGHIDAVGGAGVGRAGETAHVELGPHVGDARGLGQAGGAAGEDVERGVAGGQAIAGRQAIRPKLAAALQRIDQVALVAVRGPLHPLLDMAVQRALHLLETGRGLGVDDTVQGLGDVQAVGQGRASQLVVDQGRGDPDLRQPVPDRHVFQAVGHEQRHGLAAGDALPLGPVGVAVGDGVQLGVGDRLAFEDDGLAARPLVDGRFQIVADQVGAVRRDGLHALERARESLDELQLAFQPGRQTHRRTPFKQPLESGERRVKTRRCFDPRMMTIGGSAPSLCGSRATPPRRR